MKKDMSDGLERFIQQNREAFDDRVPPGTLWARIEQQLVPLTGWWHSVRVWRAAALLLLGVLGYVFVYSSGSTWHERKEQASIQKEVADLNLFYSGQLAEKVSLIDGLAAEDYESFAQDLQKLEAMYLVLQDELKKRPTQSVKDAIVLNWLVRLDLLNQQIHKMEKAARPKKEAVASEV
ncbi:MAG: hypothetical protein MUC38_12415 [Cyclobacteriaceae bacterium]|jgi:hypothetical protein|nr:hypothetical protein [Cyclobacteriaceae bacterium]